jgi:hypothetical protein
MGPGRSHYGMGTARDTGFSVGGEYVKVNLSDETRGTEKITYVFTIYSQIGFKSRGLQNLLTYVTERKPER